MSKLDKLALGVILNQYKAGELTKDEVYVALLKLELMAEPKVIKGKRFNPSLYDVKTTLILEGK